MQTDNGLRKGSEHADAQYSLFFNANIGKISAFCCYSAIFPAKSCFRNGAE